MDSATIAAISAPTILGLCSIIAASIALWRTRERPASASTTDTVLVQELIGAFRARETFVAKVIDQFATQTQTMALIQQALERLTDRIDRLFEVQVKSQK